MNHFYHFPIKCSSYVFIQPLVEEPTWASWGNWIECSKSCAGGKRTRARICNPDPMKNGGRACKGDSEQQESCNTGPCPGLKMLF